jgi:sulfoxide reductase catalytic subunit YedY
MIAGAGALALASPALIGPAQAKIIAAPSPFSTDNAPNSFEEITTYNNFNEFGRRDLAFCGTIGSQFVRNNPFGH